MAANDTKGAAESARLALESAGVAVAARPTDPEFQAILAQALIMTMLLTDARFLSDIRDRQRTGNGTVNVRKAILARQRRCH
jgi:hypothetical protein